MNFYTEDISNGYNWKGLERTIARMMEHLGWRDINVIGGAGDKGGDVLATRAEGNQVKSWVVESGNWRSLYWAPSLERGN